MTAEAYAAAAGLVERSAAAYVSGVPEDPADDGFFGPASVTWRVSTDLGRPVAGLRALMLQALHPLAMAGVDQHSNWRSDPVGRLAATGGYLATISFGDRAAAERAASRVRRVHEHINGTDQVTGHPPGDAGRAEVPVVRRILGHPGNVCRRRALDQALGGRVGLGCHSPAPVLAPANPIASNYPERQRPPGAGPHAP